MNKERFLGDILADAMATLPDRRTNERRRAMIQENTRLLAINAELLQALINAADALEYAAQKLNNHSINGHRVLAERLYDSRAAIARATNGVKS